MEKKLLLLVVILLVAVIEATSAKGLTFEKKILTGKPHPSEDSTFTVSYNNGIVSIQRNQHDCKCANILIQNAESHVIYSCEIPLENGQTTTICLPEDVDEEKYSLEIKCDEEERLKVYF